MATRTYRARAFMRAAGRLGARVTVGTERRNALARAAPGTTLALTFREPLQAVEQIAAFHASMPIDIIVGVDDDSTLLAAMAAERLGLPHNAVDAVRATGNKALMRRLLADAGAPSPWYATIPLADDPAAVARRVPYPCVVKPIFLSASRGVIRADTPDTFVSAVHRLRAILEDPEVAAAGGDDARRYLVEAFIPGIEVALEGMLIGGALKVLAIFDKPDPLDGPYFEETIYVTPSRHSEDEQRSIVDATGRAAEALGLREGPVHAELRLNANGAWVVEIAARTIGGLCSDTLEFSGGRSLEDLVLLHAIGGDVTHVEREPEPSGVMMLPIPARGVLRAVSGIDDARAVEGIVDLTISIPIGDEVVPLPDGNRYLGFIFARGNTPAAVEASLREAHRQLRIAIEPAYAAPLAGL
ncbi:MAG: ATP-grasp domain-containing protein [Dehalococcoidia bacterium]